MTLACLIHVSCVMCHDIVSRVMCRVSCVVTLCPVSCVMCHDIMSRVMCRASCVTSPVSCVRMFASNSHNYTHLIIVLGIVRKPTVWVFITSNTLAYMTLACLIHVSCVMCHVSCVPCHFSCVMCHMSCVPCHVSCVMCHVSRVIRFCPVCMPATPIVIPI